MISLSTSQIGEPESFGLKEMYLRYFDECSLLNHIRPLIQNITLAVLLLGDDFIVVNWVECKELPPE